MIKRLRLKFICVNMAIVTMMLLVIFGMVLHFTRANLEAQSISTLQSVMENRYARFKAPGESGQVRLPYFYVSVSPLGEVLAATGGYFDLSDQEELEAVIAQALTAEEDMGVLQSYSLRYLRRTTPFGLTMVFVDMTGEINTLRNLVKNSIFVALLSFAAFLGLSVLLSRWAIAPVEKAWKQQKQFVADASHELKTPLTVIMTNAELLEDETSTEEQKQQCASGILTMSHQMRGLVESLLELARADNGTAKMDFARLNLSELLTDALLPFEPVYFEKGLVLENEIEEGLFVTGSAAHLRQVAEVLLDNGAKYSSPNGTVTLRAERKGSHCLFSLASPGDPISREDLKNIFKRFYRIDKVRAMNHSYGLGLPIAQAIVEAHGGKIWAESSEGINTFFVQLNSVA